jgi:hypothetical protein
LIILPPQLKSSAVVAVGLTAGDRCRVRTAARKSERGQMVNASAGSEGGGCQAAALHQTDELVRPRPKLPACPMAAPAPPTRGSPVIFWSLRHGAFSWTQGRHGTVAVAVTCHVTSSPRTYATRHRFLVPRPVASRDSCSFFLALVAARIALSFDGRVPPKRRARWKIN